MGRIDHRVTSRFEQDADQSNTKVVLASLPLFVVLIYFLVEAYQRPSKPFYNLPSDVTDEEVIQAAADESGSLVPLTDMVTVLLSFCVFWTCLASYFLGFLRARKNLIEKYMDEGRSVLGNVVYEHKCWAYEFRYYGYCSYPHPERSDKEDVGDLVRKRTRIFEPYTRELVSVIYLPGFPKSGQGKDDIEYANLLALKQRPREVFLGRFFALWAIICALAPIYILHQISVIDDKEYWANIKDDYENVHKGWILYGLFLGLGVVVVGIGGNVLAWFYRRYWILHQGTISHGELSLHGYSGGATTTDSQSAGDSYRQM